MKEGIEETKGEISTKSEIPKDQYIVPLTEPSENVRKIPKALFIENIGEFLKKYEYDVAIQQMDILYRKYKFMETKLARSREVMKSKMPDIKKSLKAIEMVSKKSKEEDPSFTTTILMTDNIWTKCKIPNNTGKVCLWLGANVMIEYAYEEAEKLLSTNLGNAQTNIQATEEDLNFLKDQITTTEVNIARIYNENIRSQQQKEKKALE